LFPITSWVPLVSPEGGNLTAFVAGWGSLSLLSWWSSEKFVVVADHCSGPARAGAGAVSLGDYVWVYHLAKTRLNEPVCGWILGENSRWKYVREVRSGELLYDRKVRAGR
jgi:hypothetical protein